MIKSISIGDKFKGVNGVFIVIDIYIKKNKFWVETVHLESGAKTHTQYDTFVRLELTKMTKKDWLKYELNSLLNNGDPRICDLDRIDLLTNMLEED